jgi:hypothetical protein
MGATSLIGQGDWVGSPCRRTCPRALELSPTPTLEAALPGPAGARRPVIGQRPALWLAETADSSKSPMHNIQPFGRHDAMQAK